MRFNEIAFNSDSMIGPNTTWEGGGGKFAHTDNLKMWDNWAHDQYDGPGLWTDIENRGTEYRRNYVENNRFTGIFHEISWSAVFDSNVVTGNGQVKHDGTGGGAGILIANSDCRNTIGSFPAKCEALRNIVKNNWFGIFVREIARAGNPAECSATSCRTWSVDVHDNDITQQGASPATAAAAGAAYRDTADVNVFNTIRSIKWDRNCYHFTPTGTTALLFLWSSDATHAAARESGKSDDVWKNTFGMDVNAPAGLAGVPACTTPTNYRDLGNVFRVPQQHRPRGSTAFPFGRSPSRWPCRRCAEAPTRAFSSGRRRARAGSS
jgi:hypothetical protein